MGNLFKSDLIGKKLLLKVDKNRLIEGVALKLLGKSSGFSLVVGNPKIIVGRSVMDTTSPKLHKINRLVHEQFGLGPYLGPISNIYLDCSDIRSMVEIVKSVTILPAHGFTDIELLQINSSSIRAIYGPDMRSWPVSVIILAYGLPKAHTANKDILLEEIIQHRTTPVKIEKKSSWEIFGL